MRRADRLKKESARQARLKHLVPRNFEIRNRAWELFVIDGLSLSACAQQLGVSEMSIVNWANGDRPRWKEQRDEIHSNLTHLKFYLSKIKVGMAKDISEVMDLGKGVGKDQSQKIYALATLLRADEKRFGDAATDKPKVFLEYMTKLLEFLRARDPEALKYLEPHIRGFAESMKSQES